MEVTTRLYERSHGTQPRGEGYWAFQPTRRRSALREELYGTTEWFYGTYSDARDMARVYFRLCAERGCTQLDCTQHEGDHRARYLAVLP